MTQQNDFFTKPVKTPLEMEREKYTVEYCLEHLRTGRNIWDMRCWRKCKDVAEVRRWVREKDIKNDGHAGYCIGVLIGKKVDEDKIVQAIMDNPHISYKNRIVPCFLGDECEKQKKNGGYHNGVCDACSADDEKKSKKKRSKHADRKAVGA